MRLPANRDRTCQRCGDPDPIFGHSCWNEKRARAGILRALTAADVPGREYVADDILQRLRGDALIPGRFLPQVPTEVGGRGGDAEIVHACPPDGEAVTPCCGLTPFELPRWSSRITTDPALVTCTGRAPLSDTKDTDHA